MCSKISVCDFDLEGVRLVTRYLLAQFKVLVIIYKALYDQGLGFVTDHLLLSCFGPQCPSMIGSLAWLVEALERVVSAGRDCQTQDGSSGGLPGPIKSGLLQRPAIYTV